MPPNEDSDLLVHTLQTCFADLLEQQREQADRLHKAVEALKPKVSTDKKTTFWNAYKTLADEHASRNTAHIFAGLFSALQVNEAPLRHVV
ncbi:hypothetical protein C8R44DRAFT_987358 [Mycena epipterygia]|nr:hypothetical protein C8R44DRAFT_987358 [Mycena epipterygia]